MIEFYKTKDSMFCDEVEELLKEMVLAHRVIHINCENDKSVLPKGIAFPAIKDENEFYSGKEEILAHLKELKKIVADWRRFQSDTCYIDDKGDTC